MRAKHVAVALVALALVATACGREAEPQTVEITGVDYAFEGVPSTLAVGSTLTFTNASDAEAHELVALRIPDTETRPVSELLALPEEETDAIFGEAPPAMVLVAMPGEAGMAVVGDGTLDDAGRYALVCFFPTGGDPEVIRQAIEESGEDEGDEGPPDFGDAPPHAAQGMFAELVVE